MIALVIRAPPMPKNAKATPIARGRRVHRVLTKRYREYIKTVTATWARARTLNGYEPITTGSGQAEIHAFWNRMRHLDVDVPHGDIDAPLECLLDALEKAGVIDDDARIVRLVTEKHHDKNDPRVHIRLEPITPEP